VCINKLRRTRKPRGLAVMDCTALVARQRCAGWTPFQRRVLEGLSRCSRVRKASVDQPSWRKRRRVAGRILSRHQLLDAPRSLDLVICYGAYQLRNITQPSTQLQVRSSAASPTARKPWLNMSQFQIVGDRQPGMPWNESTMLLASGGR
jgi:hypothetical protein